MKTITLFITPKQYAAVQKLSKAAVLSVEEWLKQKALERAKKILLNEKKIQD